MDEIEWIIEDRPTSRSTGDTPNWRALLVVLGAFAALLGVYVLGQSGARQVQATPAAPGPAPPATQTSPPERDLEPNADADDEPAELTDLLGEGKVLNEFRIDDGSRVLLFCRELVPGADFHPTLAMIHVGPSPAHGEQLIAYEELARPELRSTTCAACGADPFELGGEAMLLGSCIHGAPFGASTAYVIAQPTGRLQSPLALDLNCGTTWFRVDGDVLIVEAEAPLVRGLQETRFPRPSISFERVDGRFVADDLELLHWNCDLGGSTQLAERHTLRELAPRTISSTRTDSAIGVIGVHGEMVVGLVRDQCAMLTDAWWDRPPAEHAQGSVISDLVGMPPPDGLQDWYYTCQPES